MKKGHTNITLISDIRRLPKKNTHIWHLDYTGYEKLIRHCAYRLLQLVFVCIVVLVKM